MRQLKITKSITNRESASLDKYLQEIGREELITVEEEVELAQRIRKGLGIALGRPMYVCDKNAQTGDVVLCDDAELYSSSLTAKSVNFIPFDTLTAPMRVEAKIRYAHNAAPATVYPTGENTVRVEFDTPQRAIARGQSVVFYDGDLLVGGGIIE